MKDIARANRRVVRRGNRTLPGVALIAVEASSCIAKASEIRTIGVFGARDFVDAINAHYAESGVVRSRPPRNRPRSRCWRRTPVPCCAGGSRPAAGLMLDSQYLAWLSIDAEEGVSDTGNAPMARQLFIPGRSLPMAGEGVRLWLRGDLSGMTARMPLSFPGDVVERNPGGLRWLSAPMLKRTGTMAELKIPFTACRTTLAVDEIRLGRTAVGLGAAISTEAGERDEDTVAGRAYAVSATDG